MTKDNREYLREQAERIWNEMYRKTIMMGKIKRVVFNDPATIVIWSDGTKTMVKCQDGDVYSKREGLAMCIAKRHFGNTGLYNDVFRKWVDE